MAGCNRYGVDNPLPIVTKRLAMYGNQEELAKEFKSLVQEKFKAHAHEADLIAPADFGGAGSSFETSFGRPKYMDFQETRKCSPQKKVSGIYNFNLLGSQPGREKLKKQEPAELTTDRQGKQYSVGGVKMKIQDIMALTRIESANVNDVGRHNASVSSIQQSIKSTYNPPKKKPLVSGMTAEAHMTFASASKDMTREELGISDKKIIIPSFETTSKLFAQHFHILRELRHKIDLLRQSKEDQRSLERSWYQVDRILHVLSEGCLFLDFPADSDQVGSADYKLDLDM